MADDQRNAQVVLTADTSNYQQGMIQAEQSTNKVTSSLGKLIDATNRLMTSAGKKIIGIGAVEVAGLTGATVAASALEHQMAQLTASSVITGRNFDNFSKSVTSLRTGMGLTTSEAVSLVTQLNNLGQNNQSVESLSKTFIRLGAVTGEAVGGLVDGLISLQRQMGTEGAANTEHFASSLADLSQKAGVSATSLLQFANSIAPIAKVAGVTQTELMGISTAFAKVGQDGYAASNAFNKFMTGITSAIQSGSPDMAAYANLIGKTVDEFKQMNKTDIITQIFTEINREGPAAIKTLERFGLDGVRSYKAIQAVAASGGIQDSINQAMGGQQDTTKFLSASTEALNGLTENLKKLGQSLQTVGEAFGAGLIQPASMGVKALTALLTPINALLSALGSIPGVAAAGMAAMTLVIGGAVRGFAGTTALAGFQSMRRNSFGAGFRTGAGATPKFADPAYAARVAEGGDANALMRGMYGTGRWSGEKLGGIHTAYQESRDRYYTSRDMPIPQGRNLRSRISGVAGGGIHAIGSFMSGGLSSLYPSAVYDPSSQQRAFGGQVAPHPLSGMRLPNLLRMPISGFGMGEPLSLPPMQAAPPPDRIDRMRTRLGDWATNAGGTPHADGSVTGGAGEAATKLGSSFKDLGSNIATTSKRLLGHSTEVEKSTGVFRSLGAESKNLITSLLKADVGTGMVLGGAAAKGVMRGGLGLAKGALGLMGGVPGVALMGGTALWETHQGNQANLAKISNNTEDLSASSMYRAALGEATVGVTDFATATKAAADLIKQSTGKEMTTAQAIVLTPAEATTATEGKYTDKRIADMNQQDATSFASVALNGASPKDARLLTLDINKKFGADVGAKIMQDAYSGNADMTGLFGNIQQQGSNVADWVPFSDTSGVESAGALAGSSAKQLIAQSAPGQQANTTLAVTKSGMQSYFENSRAAYSNDKTNGAASGYTAAAIVNALGNSWGTTKDEDLKSIRSSFDAADSRSKGDTNDSVDAYLKKNADGTYASSGTDSDSQMKSVLEDLVKNGSEGVKGPARAQLDALNANPKATKFKPNDTAAPFMMGVNPDTLSRLQGTPEGSQILSRYSVSGTTINTALQNSTDPLSQMGGANAIYNRMAAGNPIPAPVAKWKDQSTFQQDSQPTRINGALQGTIDSIAKFQQGIEDATSPLGQMAAAAMSVAQAARSRQENFQTSGETAEARATEFEHATAAVKAGDRSPAAVQRALDAKGGVEEAINTQNEKNKSIVYAYRSFSIQRDRSETQYDLQRTRSTTAFNLQNSYASADFSRSRKINDDSYNLSRSHALRDYNVSLKESWYQYNLSRTRAEVEFNHQVVMMAKQSAKSIYDVYTRIKVEQTWSAQSLLANMADQQKRLVEQQANLAKVRKMGLSGDVIDQLGLNDPSKSQQLARMVDEMVNDPKMIEAFNKGIVDRLGSATKVVTDKDNEAWQEMQRSFKLSMDNGQTDMLHGLGVQNAAFAQSMTDQRNAYQLSIDLSIESFNKNRDRQLLSFNLGMTQMAHDHAVVMDNARKDFSTSYEEISGDFGQMAAAALAATDGNAKAQGEIINKRLGDLLLSMYATLQSLGLTDAEMPYTPSPLTGKTTGDWTKMPARAEGGVVPGHSPHRKADDILIRATAGEYVQPVEVVQHYGIDMMDRIRRRQVRKEELEGYADGGLIWPTNTRTLSASYPGHSGVDIAASMGAPIYAPMAGSIEYTGWDRGYGQAIFERFASGLEAVFGHTSKVLASIGQVKAGDTIGLVGSTGHSTGPHLHFEINSPGPFGNSADRAPSLVFLNGLKDGSAAMMSAGAGAVSNGDMSMTPEQFHDLIANLPPVKDITEALDNTVLVKKYIIPDLIASRATKKYGPLLASRNPAASGAAFSGSVSAQANELIAQGLLGNYGWSTAEMPALTKLWNNESGWNQHAKNPSSGAYGIPQALPANKMGSIAPDWMDNPETQIRWGLQYIKERYGSPSATLSKWNTQHWYGEGGMFNSKQLIGVGEKGPEAVLPLNAKGATFLADVMGQMSNTETKKALVQAGGRTTTAKNQTYYQQVDRSTNFTGAISVTSNDPGEFIRKLEDQKRMKALTGR